MYIKKNELVDEFVILQSKSKNAIYSNMTALYLHGFSNRIPLKYDITINNGYNGSLQKNNNVNLFYTKKELLNLYSYKELYRKEKIETLDSAINSDNVKTAFVLVKKIK